MFPSGYKEDKIYSLKPTDGSGDLTFTRASTATRVNADGLIETSPVNLLQQSNTFNTTWVSAGPGATITSGQTDPNAGSNAWLLSKLGATGRIQQTVNVGGVQTFFIYAKKNTSDYILINVFDGTTSHECWFNLSTGAVGVQNSSTGAIESVGNGWYKCSVTSTNLIASGIIQIYQSDGNGNVTGASGSIYIFNSQLNIGATAKPYFPTTDRLNVPRIDYTGGGCGKLLLEPQRTNLALYSEQFDNAAWSKNNVSITANSLVSPDGTQNADTITSSGSTSFVFRNTPTLVGSHTISFYAKKGTSNFCWIYLNGYNAIFNLDTGVYVTSVSNAPSSYSITSVGNGWYRITATQSTPILDSVSGIGVGTANSFNGVVGTNVYIWGAQLEAGSYVSSYIPTLASSVTRLADAAFKTGISSLIGQTEGTMYWEGYSENNASFGTCLVLQGSPGYWIYILSYNGGFTFEIRNAYVASMLYNSTSAAGNYKIAIGYNASQIVIYINGTLVHTDNSVTIPALSSVYLANWENVYNESVKTGQAVLFKTRLTNAELASLTTL
jgi:hypothetical protein